jgi:two-component system response regulator DegU
MHRPALNLLRGKERVIFLIVEDNVAVRRLIRRAIACQASEIYECGDGADAVELYSRYQPDLVFMDVEMPRMDGLAAARLIIRSYPRARIIIVTDYDDDEFRAVAVAAGAIGYVLKDDLAELERLVTTLHLRER